MMKKNKKFLLLVMLLLAVSLIFAGCNSEENVETEGETKEETENVDTTKEKVKDKIKVGMDGEYLPICYVEDGEPKGFEVEVWKEIGKRANLDVEFVVAQWTGLYGMLDTDKIDAIACQMSKTPEREEKYTFSNTYLYTPLQFAVKGYNDTINSLEDLKGKKVGVAAGGNEYNVLMPLAEEYEFEIVTYEGSGIEYDVAMGRTDACLQSAISVTEHIKKGELDLKLVGKPISYEEDGYPFKKTDDNKELIEAVNKAIDEMHEDGTLSRISEEILNIDATKKVE